MNTFESSIDEWLKANDWVGPDEQPMITSLLAMAKTLDIGPVSPTMLNVFGQTFRHLMKAKKDHMGSTSDDDDFLDAL